jgi:hypothetical protein
MKNIISIMLLFSLLTVLATSCDNGRSTINQNKSETKKQKYNSRYLFVKDESKYEKSFVEGLKTYSERQKEHLKLIDDVLTVNNDKYPLPSDIEKGKQYFFSRKKTDRQTDLVLKTHNYSSLEYDLKISIDDKIIFKKTGIVTLNELFFIGAEPAFDEETESEYFPTTYIHEDNGGFINIKVGVIKKRLRASVDLKEFSDLPALKLVKVKTIKPVAAKFDSKGLKLTCTCLRG